MQTFITDVDMASSARNLDDRRLGKQRVEAIQILRTLLGMSSQGWRNHPIVKMWRGHETYLLKVYLKAILDEWVARGFRNDKCAAHYDDLVARVPGEPIAPPWIDEALIRSHRSNLVRKDPAFYGPRFPGVPGNLPYDWRA